jgi:hypothetical protein
LVFFATYLLLAANSIHHANSSSRFILFSTLIMSSLSCQTLSCQPFFHHPSPTNLFSAIVSCHFTSSCLFKKLDHRIVLKHQWIMLLSLFFLSATLCCHECVLLRPVLYIEEDEGCKLAPRDESGALLVRRFYEGEGVGIFLW